MKKLIDYLSLITIIGIAMLVGYGIGYLRGDAEGYQRGRSTALELAVRYADPNCIAAVVR